MDGHEHAPRRTRHCACTVVMPFGRAFRREQHGTPLRRAAPTADRTRALVDNSAHSTRFAARTRRAPRTRARRIWVGDGSRAARVWFVCVRKQRFPLFCRGSSVFACSLRRFFFAGSSTNILQRFMGFMFCVSFLLCICICTCIHLHIVWFFCSMCIAHTLHARCALPHAFTHTSRVTHAPHIGHARSHRLHLHARTCTAGLRHRIVWTYAAFAFCAIFLPHGTLHAHTRTQHTAQQCMYMRLLDLTSLNACAGSHILHHTIFSLLERMFTHSLWTRLLRRARSFCSVGSLDGP